VTLNPDGTSRNSEGMKSTVSGTLSVAPGVLELREPPAGLPDPNLQPPSIAESGDPFSTVRILHLLASVERGPPIRVDDLSAALNARYLDWSFSAAVVTDAVVQLQSNWMADYRNSSGIVIDDGPYGTTVGIEDSTRFDPWIVRQVERARAACQDALATFSRRDGTGSNE